MKVMRGEHIFFVTSSDIPFFPGSGGTEAFTFGHVRELRRRGFDARIVTVGLKDKDGRRQLPDIPFLDVPDEQTLATIDAYLVAMCRPFSIKTKMSSFIMAHVSPIASAYPPDVYKKAMQNHTLITNSNFNRKEWSKALSIDPDAIRVVYPFAEDAFGKVTRPPAPKKTRVLFAGRLHIHKGIFLLLEALHHPILQHNYRFTVAAVADKSQESQKILDILTHHPDITVTQARANPAEMAELLAEHDVVVMPSNHFFWQEAFGMLAVEAQHAGCRVVASDFGGLPETDVGVLYLFEPGNSLALANAIEEARKAGPVSRTKRNQSVKQFTVAQSVDSLLRIIGSK